MNRTTHRSNRVRVLSLVTLAVLAASCSASTSVPGSTTQVVLPDSPTTSLDTTTTSREMQPATESPVEIDWHEVESVATGFMAARGDRDVDSAQAYLHEEVAFDWGPNDGRDGLSAAWAWEDAFRLTHTLQECEALSDGNEPAARCRLRVDSEVAETAGLEAGFVCIDITVYDGLIREVTGLDSAEGCTYNYWVKTFQPFATWLAGAHPDTTIDEMYRDRTSPEGLELWVLYVDEYFAGVDP